MIPPPPRVLSVPKAIETLKGMHIPPDQIVRVLDKMMPAINAQNKQAADAFNQLETNAAKGPRSRRPPQGVHPRARSARGDAGQGR